MSINELNELSTTPHNRTNHGACAYACNRSIHYNNWYELALSALYTTRRKYRMVSKSTNDWGLLRPRLHKVRAINRAYGIEFTLSHGCHVLQHTSARSNSCLRWHLFNHTKGSQLWPITTSITRIINVNRLSNECITHWSHGTISVRTNVRDKRPLNIQHRISQTPTRTNVRWIARPTIVISNI